MSSEHSKIVEPVEKTASDRVLEFKRVGIQLLTLAFRKQKLYTAVSPLPSHLPPSGSLKNDTLLLWAGRLQGSCYHSSFLSDLL